MNDYITNPEQEKQDKKLKEVINQFNKQRNSITGINGAINISIRDMIKPEVITIKGKKYYSAEKIDALLEYHSKFSKEQWVDIELLSYALHQVKKAYGLAQCSKCQIVLPIPKSKDKDVFYMCSTCSNKRYKK
jgi:hypothetical protein